MARLGRRAGVVGAGRIEVAAGRGEVLAPLPLVVALAVLVNVDAVLAVRVHARDVGDEVDAAAKEMVRAEFSSNPLDLVDISDGMTAFFRGKEFTAEEAAKFDISVVLGKPCILNVIHKTGGDGKVRARIDSVGPLMKGLPVPALEGEMILYDGDQESSPVWDKLRPWMHEAIKRQKEPGKADDLPEQRGGGEPAAMFDPDLDDDVPFASCDPALEHRIG